MIETKRELREYILLSTNVLLKKYLKCQQISHNFFYTFYPKLKNKQKKKQRKEKRHKEY